VVAKCAIGEANAGGISKSLKADSCAKVDLLQAHGPGCKTLKCLITHSGIGADDGVALERLLADSCVGAYIHSLDVSECASGIVKKRPGAHGCVAAGGVE